MRRGAGVADSDHCQYQYRTKAFRRRPSCSCARAPLNGGGCSTAAWMGAASSASWFSTASSCSRTTPSGVSKPSMATANRADVFFKAPRDSAGKVFTVLAQEEILHTDNFQGRQQRRVLGRQGFGGNTGNPPPSDVVVAHVHVRGAAIARDFDVMSLEAALPPVPPFLQPIADDEIRMTAAEARQHKAPAGSHRTRTVSYNGYGAAAFPLVEVPDAFAKAHPELRNLRWAE